MHARKRYSPVTRTPTQMGHLKRILKAMAEPTTYVEWEWDCAKWERPKWERPKWGEPTTYVKCATSRITRTSSRTMWCCGVATWRITLQRCASRCARLARVLERNGGADGTA